MNQSRGTATISLEKQLFTLVNVFSVKPSNQKKVIQLLQDDIEEVIRNLPASSHAASMPASMVMRL